MVHGLNEGHAGFVVNHIVSYMIPYHIIPYYAIPYHTIPYHIIPYHIIYYIIYYTISHHISHHHLMSYHIIPYHIIFHLLRGKSWHLPYNCARDATAYTIKPSRYIAVFFSRTYKGHPTPRPSGRDMLCDFDNSITFHYFAVPVYMTELCYSVIYRESAVLPKCLAHNLSSVFIVERLYCSANIAGVHGIWGAYIRPN